MKKTRNNSDNTENKLRVRKTYTLRFYILVLSAVVSIVGVGLFIIYFKTLNMACGLFGIVMVVVGLYYFRHFWVQGGNLSVDHTGGKQSISTFNSLCLYPSKVVFENVKDPQGFPMICENDRKRYYVNIWDDTVDKLKPFVLPDQQYYDPTVFAQRVLGLPAHKKIFERKPTLLQKLKTAMLVLAIGIVWLLILTTTGGG